MQLNKDQLLTMIHTRSETLKLIRDNIHPGLYAVYTKGGFQRNVGYCKLCDKTVLWSRNLNRHCRTKCHLGRLRDKHKKLRRRVILKEDTVSQNTVKLPKSIISEQPKAVELEQNETPVSTICDASQCGESTTTDNFSSTDTPISTINEAKQLDEQVLNQATPKELQS